MKLGELFQEARLYGLVDLFTHDDGSYSCVIKFHTINHTELKAKSGFNKRTPEEAVTQAIEAAKNIVGEMSDLKDKINQKQLT